MHVSLFYAMIITVLITNISSILLQLQDDHPEKFLIEQDFVFRGHNQYYESAQLPASIAFTWNLDRIDQHSKILDDRYNPATTAEGVDVYVLDTGILYTHHDLEGRAKYPGYDAIDHLTNDNRNGSDCIGHGTHCAGIMGGGCSGWLKR